MAVVDPFWAERGACTSGDPEAFFPMTGVDPQAVRAAKRVCGRCPVRRECLDYAVVTGQKYGVWGGTDENERRHLLAEQRRAAAA